MPNPASAQELLKRLNQALSGQYVFHRELGRGGMGTVFLAQDLKHDRSVAIKTMEVGLLSGSGPDRFLREIRTTAGLTHPHIVGLYDSGETDGIAYYVMEHIEGESLRDRLDRMGPLPVKLATRITKNIADALQHAHDRGFVHRDIKPGNILLSAQDEVWVADFGLVRAVVDASDPQLTGTGHALGSPYYMSPEQVSGGKDIDGRSDQYSLACVLFEMLTGQPPFKGNSSRTVLAQHLAKSPPLPGFLRPGLPSSFNKVILKALEKDPTQRYTEVGLFANAVRDALDGDPPTRFGRTLNRSFPRGQAFLSWARSRLVPLALGITATAIIVWLVALEPGPEGTDIPRPPPANRIAVMYFEDGSLDGSLRHITEGLTTRLTHELGLVQGLDVVPASGVRLFQEKDLPLDSLVHGLGVGSLVTGSVESAGGQLAITVQLLDSEDGSLLATARTMRPETELFTVLDDVASHVAGLLRRRLGREVTLQTRLAETDNAEALDLVMKGDLAVRDAEDLLKGTDPAAALAALQLLRVADSVLTIAEGLDPGWAEPRILRGWTFWHRASFSASDQRAELFGEALSNADSAVAIQASSGPAHELRGATFFRMATTFLEHPSGPDWINAAESELRAATEADRSLARAWSTLSSVLLYQGLFSEANHAAQVALEEDAYLSNANEILESLFRTSFNLGREEDARNWCEEGRRSFPSDWRFLECTLSLQAWAETVMPDPTLAWRLLEELNELDPTDKATAVGRPYSAFFRRMLVASVLARAGLSDSALVVYERTRDALPEGPDLRLDFAYDEARLRLQLGEVDRAIQLLAEYLAGRPDLRSFVAEDPRLSRLSQNPRFRSLMSGS